MNSRGRGRKTPQNVRGGRLGSKRDPPQTTEKTGSSRTSRVDEPDIKKSTLLKEKVDRPKKEKADFDLIPDAKREPNRGSSKNVRDQEFDDSSRKKHRVKR